MKRRCCDGLCQQGRFCPAFAPGVIEGPYKRSVRRAAATKARTAYKGVTGGLRMFWDYLMGPRP